MTYNNGINNPMFGKKRPEHSIRMKGIDNPNITGIYTKGKNNGNYLDGRTLRIYYCKDCNKELNNYKAKRCLSCNTKNRKQNPMQGKSHSFDTRRKQSLRKGGTGIPYENNIYPIEFFKIRNKILERDNYVCQLCVEYGNEVHHIDYDKMNNKKKNLTTLCHKCNMKVNKNRLFWTNILWRLT